MIHKARILVLAFALASCAEVPENLFAPVSATAPGASTVDLLVATTRRAVANSGELFSGERGFGLSFANVIVSIPPGSAHESGEIQWPKTSPGNPATDFVVAGASRLDVRAARAWLDRHGSAARRHRVLIFVHGYNTPTSDAVFRTAQIVHDSGAEATPVVFTWPSRANLLSYGYDRESANLSRDSFEQLLNMLVGDPAVREIDILAHSMGNWLTVETLRQMAIRHGRIPPRISDVMMAAPDVDVDVFQNEIADMGEPRPRFTLFASRDDKALALSTWIWGSDARLGAINPNVEPYRSRLAAEHVNVFDLTDIKSDDSVNHTKFAKSPELVQLIGNRLASGQSLSDAPASIADRVLAGVANDLGAIETSVEEVETAKGGNAPAK